MSCGGAGRPPAGVDCGRKFEDADAVVAAGLDLMQQKEKYEELKAAIDVGYRQFLQGEVVQLEDGFFERVLDGARERSRRGVPVSNDVKP